MSYTPTNWTDGTSPVDASNLNKLEQAVSENSDLIDGIGTPFTLSFNNYTDINDESDLNNIRTPGVYVCTSNSYAANIENSPSARAFVLIVMNTVIAGGYLQFVLPYMPSSGNAIYERYFYNAAWGTWLTIA